MIKALRLSSILLAALACYFLAFPLVFGSGGNATIEEDLQKPTAIEKFRKDDREGSGRPGNRESPLLKEAIRFANYLNPPKPKPEPRRHRDIKRPKPVEKEPSKPPEPSRATQVKPRFNLIAVSYNESRPADSVALIDAPGKGRHWVRQSEEMAGLRIEIKDGLVVAKGSGREYEMTVAHQPHRSILAGASSSMETSKPVSSASVSGSGNVSDNGSVGVVSHSGSTSERDTLSEARKKSGTGPPSVPETPRQLREERGQKAQEIANALERINNRGGSGSNEDSKAQEIVSILESMKKGGSGKVDSGGRSASGKISGGNSRISDREAQKLDSLGEELDKSESTEELRKRLDEQKERNRERMEKLRERIKKRMEKRR